MRKTIPAIFFILAILGASAIGYAAGYHNTSQVTQKLVLAQNERQKLDLDMAELKTQHAKQIEELEASQSVNLSKIDDLAGKLGTEQAKLNSSASAVRQLDAKNKTLTNNLALISTRKDELEQQLTVLASEHARQLDQQSKSFDQQLNTQINQRVKTERANLISDHQTQIDELQKTLSELAEKAKSQTDVHTNEIQQLVSAHQEIQQTAKEEKDYLYAELDRYTKTSNAMLNKLGEDVGGLDILLSPEFKATFREFLGEINIGSN